MIEVKITTKKAFALLNLIKKLNLKDTILDTVKKFIKLDAKKQELYRELYSKSEEEITKDNEKDIAIRLLNENKDIAEKLSDLEEEFKEDGMKLVFELIEKIPEGEKEFYKSMSVVFNESVKIVEEKEIDEIVEMIIAIFKSKSFQGLSSVMNK
ncbi:hypothetical protein QJR30_07640 [Paraclostridium sordellii]|uniref:hypothetical protein n=1 Tax=Paraclostridium sordellii TaxID=1505 RepID=UPI0030CA7FEC